MLAGLPYVVWPIGSLFILASRKKEDPFLHYHAVQALLAGGAMALGVLIVILVMIVGFRVMPGSASYIPAFLGFGTIVVSGSVALAILLTAVFLGWRATEGEMLKIPILGDYAEEKMLDQTGMTRREFAEMCERAMVPEEPEEEIPFPEVQKESSAPAPRAIDRLEAARAARAQAEASRAQAQESAPPPPRQTREPASPPQSAPTPSPSPQRNSRDWGPLPRPGQPSPSKEPRVREVDLIGHYKEKKVETGPQGGKNADVLRQWLSSVDNE